MRLYLAIHRHGLPPASLLWTVGSIASVTPVRNTDSKSLGTIAQLLEHVNETIPLEAGEWGLEEYVVEVNGFECLHFQEVQCVLKDDDYVDIRPLSTIDLRSRKLSGRHQISTDGKHLIDGVAFGRPFFRASVTRPPVVIPPRKRRRITEADEVLHITARETPDANRQLVLRADFEDADQENRLPSRVQFAGIADAGDEGDNDVDNDDDEDDDDYEDDENDDDSDPEEDSDDDSGEDHTAEAAVSERDEDEAEKENNRPDSVHGTTGDSNVVSLPTQAEEYRKKKRALSEIYRPRSRLNALRITDGAGQDLVDEVVLTPSTGIPDLTNSDSISGKLLQRSMHHGKYPALPSGSKRRAFKILTDSGNLASSGATDTSDVGEVEDDDMQETLSSRPRKRQRTTVIDTDMRYRSPMEPDSDDTSSSDTSSASASSSSSSSDASTSSDEEDSGSESEQSTSDGATDISNKSSKPAELLTNTSTTTAQGGKSQSHPPVPPGHGLTATRKRNERRRSICRLAHLKRIAELPHDATIEVARQRTASREPAASKTASRGSVDSRKDHTAKDATPITNGVKPYQKGKKSKTATTKRADLETRRQALLASIATGGVEVSSDHARTVKPPTAVVSSEPVASTNPSPEQEPEEDVEPAPSMDVSKSMGLKAKAKLDLTSSRRMLFGSLGLRTPSTKEDEERLRLESRTKAAEVAAKHKPTHRVYAQDDEEQVMEKGKDDSWQDRIKLSAVECVDGEDIVLSTPPFPFVQRWDPQQQYGHDHSTGGGRGARKKRKRRKAQETQGEEHPVDDDDLPVMPTDPKKCPDLTKVIVQPGMVIGFQQLILTADWQPILSAYRTALVEKVDGGDLELLLAKRDTVQREKAYDEETGDRIYGNFEMPDNEAQDEDARVLSIGFDELLEPKVVRDAVAAPVPDNVEKDLLPGSMDGSNSPKIHRPDLDPVTVRKSIESTGQSCATDFDDTVSTSDLRVRGECIADEMNVECDQTLTRASSVCSSEQPDKVPSETSDHSETTPCGQRILDGSVKLPDIAHPSPAGLHGGRSILLPIGAVPTSDSEFPELDTLFSTARTSLESANIDSPTKRNSYSAVKEQLASTPVKPSDTQESTTPRSDDEQITPRPSKVLSSNEMVDLTTSSPALIKQVGGEDRSLNAALGLPTGPGWVQKRKTTLRAARKVTGDIPGKRPKGRPRKMNSI